METIEENAVTVLEKKTGPLDPPVFFLGWQVGLPLFFLLRCNEYCSVVAAGKPTILEEIKSLAIDKEIHIPSN